MFLQIQTILQHYFTHWILPNFTHWIQLEMVCKTYICFNLISPVDFNVISMLCTCWVGFKIVQIEKIKLRSDKMRDHIPVREIIAIMGHPSYTGDLCAVKDSFRFSIFQVHSHLPVHFPHLVLKNILNILVLFQGHPCPTSYQRAAIYKGDNISPIKTLKCSFLRINMQCGFIKVIRMKRFSPNCKMILES